MTRKQCKKCPWRIGVDPNEIPNGYSRDKHVALSRTIAEPGSIADVGGPIRLMACHESAQKAGSKDLPCVGWLMNQLGPGNNIALRLALIDGLIDAKIATVGPQHPNLEATIPRETASPPSAKSAILGRRRRRAP